MTRATHVLAVTALAFVAMPAAPPAAIPPDFSRPRDLPSMVTRWESAGKACAVIVRDGTAYVLRHDGLEAREVGGGGLRWKATVAPGDCPYPWQKPLQVIEGWLLAGLRDRLLIVDRSSGRVQHTIPLGGFLSHLSGPPVAVVVGHQHGPYELLSLDIDAGTVRARRTLPSSVSSLASAAGTIVAVWSEEQVYTAHGLAPGDLSEVWRSTVYSEVLAEDGTLYGTGPDEDCACDTRFSVLEAASGMPVERRPRREPDHNSTTAGRHLPWDLQLVGPEHPYFDLRRNRREDGRPMWTTVLPGGFGAWARKGDSLFLHVEPRGRGLLVEMDWNSGALRRGAYGLRSVYAMAATGDVIVLHTEEGVTAVASRAFGPPEATLRPAADEARRILAAPMDYWDLGTPQGELAVLGPTALPVITGLIPSMGPLPLRVAASLLAEEGYRPAARKLADRLPSLGSKEHEPFARTAVLDALARIGGAEQVPQIVAVLADPAQPSYIRFSAFTSLASIATPEAVVALDAATSARRAPAGPWWKRPLPAEYAGMVGGAPDTDGDGIPDLAERRLFLDPTRADTDGDGLVDPVDPVPNAAPGPQGEEAAVATAFFEQYLGIYSGDETRHPVVVVSDHALPRYGRLGPTLVLTAREMEKLSQEAERDKVSLPSRLSLEPVGTPGPSGRAMPLDAWTSTGGRPDRPRAEERALVFTTYTGPLSAAGYHVVMRKIGERWYVRSFVQTWVS